MRVLLASASPRRRELMKEIFSGFDVRAFPCDENYIGDSPEDTVSEISLRKLNAASELFCDYDVIVACDTLVYMDGEYFGKPKDVTDAVKMLKKLSGRTHTVYSGVSVLKEGRLLRKVARSEVKFRDLTNKEISDYVSAHSVLDKAGAYAIQDGVVVEKYEGSYSNIVGLPVELLREMI